MLATVEAVTSTVPSCPALRWSPLISTLGASRGRYSPIPGADWARPALPHRAKSERTSVIAGGRDCIAPEAGAPQLRPGLVPSNSVATGGRRLERMSHAFLNDTAPTEIYSLSLHGALPI